MNPEATAASRLQRIVAAALLLLIGATWRLWLPPGDYPQIPWWSGFCRTPAAVDAAFLTLLLTSGAVVVFAPAATRLARIASALLPLALVGLTLLDQLRLQPWVLHLGLLAGLLALAPGETGLRCCRGVVIGIYLWSGWSKLDPAFPGDHGRLLLDGLTGSLGLSTALWSDVQRRLAAWLMPAGEVLTAVLLLCPRWRRWGLWASLLLHGLLLLALGPLGLRHEPAVLLWNLTFIIQNLVLFGRRTTVPDETAPAPESSVAGQGREISAVVVATVATLLPVLNPPGWYDHWPSWSVYSSRPEVVWCDVRESAVDRLPASLREWVEPPQPLEDWRRVRLDQWSFAELSVPPYPQGRWKLAAAAAMSERAGLPDDALRVGVESRRGWWSVERETRVLEGRGELAQELLRFRVNTLPRR